MTSHKDYRLDQLGITSQYEADELERDLGVRFDQFAYNDREVWVQQNAYLDAYAHNGAVSDSADVAGVSVPTAQAWKYLNMLGFKNRLEIADLRFSDSLQVLALERVREPDAPASLLIALLRAHIPEKFSSNGHVCDTSKADEIHFFLSQDAGRELDAGPPPFRAIADRTYQPHRRSRSHDEPSYTDTPSEGAGVEPPAPSASPRHSHERHVPCSDTGTSPRTTIRGGNPLDISPHSIEPDQEVPSSYDSEESTPHDDIQPVDPDEVDYFNLSPSPEENTSSPSAVNPNIPPTRHSRESGNPLDISPHSIEPDQEIPSSYESEESTPHDDIQPVDPDEVAYFNLSPSPEENTSSPSVSSPSPVVGESLPRTRYGGRGEGDLPQNPARRPIATLFQRARPNLNDNPNTFKSKRF